MSLFPKICKSFRVNINTLLICVGILSHTNTLVGQVWQDYPQPIGTLARVYNVAGALPFPVQSPPPAQPFPAPTTPLEEINYITAQWDNNITTATSPFDVNFPATEFISTQSQHFVRVYAPGNAPNTGSGPNGAWFMRPQELRGLTPAQIQDRFALQTPPTMIINVEFPASPSPSGKQYALWTGVCGPIAGWGNGGAFQNRIVADFNGTHYFPNYAFTLGTRTHPQPIGAYALAYTPMAGHGNAGKVAAYLDKFIPTLYSDLDYVYTALDFLNWIDFGPDPLRSALNQISPERYGALTFVAMRNALLFGNTILDFRYPINNCLNPCVDSFSCGAQVCAKPKYWLQGVAEQGCERTEGHRTGFSYKTGGGIAGVDFQISRDVSVGVTGTYLNNSLRFHEDGGSGRMETVKGGLYASYDQPYYFVDGLLSGGYSWGKVHRNIEFLGVDRHAHSHPDGLDVEAHLQCGLNLSICNWSVTPLARASYFYVDQNHFHEHGADSLDLNIHSFSAQTLRFVLGSGLTRTFCFNCFNLIPQIQLAWAHDCSLDRRHIRSDLIALGDVFTIKGFDRDCNSFLAAAQLTAQVSNNVSIIARYEAEVEHYFYSQMIQLSADWKF